MPAHDVTMLLELRWRRGAGGASESAGQETVLAAQNIMITTTDSSSLVLVWRGKICKGMHNATVPQQQKAVDCLIFHIFEMCRSQRS
jgi:hypothetical protein